MSAARTSDLLAVKVEQLPPGPGDEVSPRSWEKRAEMIDSKKDELNKDQWRLIRDHVHMNIREISKIFRDLEAIKTSHSQLASATAERDQKINDELRFEISNLKRDLEEEKSQRATKTTSIERLLVSLTDRLNANDAADETLKQQVELNVAGLKKDAKEKHQMVMDRIGTLETAVSEEFPGLLAEVKDNHRKLHTNLNQQLDALKAAHENHKAAHGDALSAERAMREQALNDLQNHVHRRFGEEKNARESHVNDLHKRMDDEKGHRENHMRNTADLISAERAKREKAVADLMDAHENGRANDKRERDDAHGALRSLLDKERQAREAHHGQFHSKLEEERAAREKHVLDLLGALDAHKGNWKQALQDELAKERKARDAAHGDLRELIDGHHGKFSDLIENEKAARAAHLEDSLGKALGKEGAAREKMMQELFDKCRAEGDLVLQHKLEAEFADRENRIAKLQGQLEADIIAREEDLKRIEYVETVIGGGYLGDPNVKRLATLQNQLEALRKSIQEDIIEEKQARETWASSVTETFRKDRIDRDGKIKDEIANFKKHMIVSLQTS